MGSAAETGTRSVSYIGLEAGSSQSHFVFDPLVFIERLAALVPPPRMHQLTYHGVLSSAASRRSEIVPGSQPPTAPESAGPSSSPPTPTPSLQPLLLA